ncbi:MAG: alpha/beta fold hydrolase [Pseudomonadota bacterium]
MTAPDRLELSPDRIIAYHRTSATGAGQDRPGVVFLGGFKSDMEGTKALALEDWARGAGRAFLRFDYRGHGRSSGAFEDGCVSDWADDAREAVARLTEGPQILVGSSMGGWIALLLARAAPERVAGLVGIAAAPDFTVSMKIEMDRDAEEEMEATGRWTRPSAYSEEPYVITKKLLDDGADNLVLPRPYRAGFPVRLLQGTEDEDVPVAVAERLFEHIEADDLSLTLVKGAGHRFSEPKEIALIVREVEALG